MTVVLRYWWIFLAVGSGWMRYDGWLGHVGHLVFLAAIIVKVDHQGAWLYEVNQRVNRLYRLSATTFVSKWKTLKDL